MQTFACAVALLLFYSNSLQTVHSARVAKTIDFDLHQTVASNLQSELLPSTELAAHKNSQTTDYANRESGPANYVTNNADKPIKVRESSEIVSYKKQDLRATEIASDSQIVRVHLDSLASAAHTQHSLTSPLTASNCTSQPSPPAKQAQTFDTHLGSSTGSGKPTSAPTLVVGGSTWTFTTQPTPTPTQKPQCNNLPEPTNSTNTCANAKDQQPPTPSKTTRDGSAINCGEANANGRSGADLLTPNRIVGGRKSEPGEFPFQVRLNIRSRRGSGICGGILLDDQHILTAAHCMTSCVSQYLETVTIETSGVLATIGDHSIKAHDGEQEVEILRIKAHEKYDACNFYANDNDIAILKLAQKVNFKFTSDGYGSINRPCLPSNASVAYHDGSVVIVSGWGVTREFSGALSNILRYVKLPVVNNSACQEVYGSRVTELHVCAGLQAGGRDSCQGDSGGPLVRVTPNNRYELVGIVSFGYGCAQPGAYGVYTRIASYLDWIKANL